MINGELVVDSFAGGGGASTGGAGKGKSARVMHSKAHRQYADRRGAERAITICMILRRMENETD